jgi:hypothetical protein
MGFIPPLAINLNNSSSVYFGAWRIWQTFDGASTWFAATGDLTNGNATVPITGCLDQDEITTIGVSGGTSGIIFADTGNGKVWQTTTGFSMNLEDLKNAAPGMESAVRKYAQAARIARA